MKYTAPDKSLSRRLLLRGAGGLAVTLPWLEFTARDARAQGAAPTKLLVVSAGHSVEAIDNRNSWAPGSADLSTLSPLLDPLMQHRSRILVPTGIGNLLNQSRLVPSNGHNFPSRSLLTCMPTAEALDGNGNLLANIPQLSTTSAAAGPSMEHVVANAWGSKMVNLRVGGALNEHRRSYRMDGTEDVGESHPQTAFDRLFAGTGGAGGTASPADQLRARRKSILDAVKGNFDEIRVRLGVEDRVRLDRHAAHLRDIEGRLQTVTRIACENPLLTPSRALPASATAFTDGTGPNDDLAAEAQHQVAALALSCQAARVAHIHFSNYQNNTFPWLNGGQPYIASDWHGVVHGEFGTDEQRLRTMRWYMEAFSNLLTTLAQTPDGPGSLLDSTLVLWISSLSSSAHGAGNLPIVLAGNLGGVPTGRHLNFGIPPERGLGDLYITMFKMLGIPITTFGWDKGLTNRKEPYMKGLLPGMS